jgi:hypothetical protein
MVSNRWGSCDRCFLVTEYPDPHTCQLSIFANILNLLAGPDGDHCKQWRTLYLQAQSFPYLFEGEKEIRYIKGLTYPMPALEELYLNDFVPFGQVFPSCPQLKAIHFDSVYLNTSLDMGNAQHVVYVSGVAIRRYDAPIDLSAAKRLETFRLSMRSEIDSVCLPRSLPFLTKLTMEGFLPPHFLCPTMPRLTHLNISRTSWLARDITTTLYGINLSQLQVLEIHWSYDSSRKSGWPYDDLTELLAHLDNDILLKVSLLVFMVLLKLKLDTTKAQLESNQNAVGVDFFRRGNLNVEIEGEEGYICISKDESLKALVKMAGKRGLPTPYHSWDNMFLLWSKASGAGGGRMVGDFISFPLRLPFIRSLTEMCRY